LYEYEHKETLKASYLTLGCKLNFAETSTLADRLYEIGIARAAENEVADICVINTCTVTETSNHKCRQAISRMMRHNPGAMIVVMGCYAQLAGRELAKMDGVDVVIGMEDKGCAVEIIRDAYNDYIALATAGAADDTAAGDVATGDTASDADNCAAACCGLAEDSATTAGSAKAGNAKPSLHRCHEAARKDIRTFVPSCSRGERTRFFLKVQDGCDYFCSYCTISNARGRSRNGSIESLVAQAEDAVRRGGREIVLTGVNTGDFGRSTGETFLDLIKALDKVEGVERYRISSVEPNLLTTEIIDFCAASRHFMPHFHIPLQSGSNDVLRLMRRRYDAQLFASRVEYIRRVMPDAFIGVDIIVGMRGETEEFFEDSLRFASSIDVSQYHVFSYSERPGTAALRIPLVVDEREKHRRSKQLMALSESKRVGFYERYIGTVRPVLTEHSHAGFAAKGFTDNYIRVEIPSGVGLSLADNSIVKCRLTGFNPDKTALLGEPLAD
jgi:threonylcarbamoyladenosine tRNA methylthiotransferase MtaB